MKLFRQFATIRAKVIVGIVVLILSIQIGSSVFQYFQTRSILMEEFTLGSRNLVEPLYTILREQMNDSLGNMASFDREEAAVLYEAYLKMMGFNHLDPILNAKKDLLAIQFVGTNEKIIVKSSQKKDGNESIAAESDSGEDEEDLQNPVTKKLLKNQVLAAAERADEFEVFVPFFFQEQFMGGFVLIYSKARINSVKIRTWVVSLVLILIYTTLSVTLVTIFANRILTRPVKRMKAVVEQVAKGDLDQSIEITGKDEISEIAGSLNQLISTLKLTFHHINRVMKEVEIGNLTNQIDVDLEGDFQRLKESINTSIRMVCATISQTAVNSDQVRVGSTELSRVSAEISDNTNRMASTLEEISSSMMEIEQKTRSNTENAANARKLSGSTMELVEKGNGQMETMMASINEISETSTNVSKIIGVIDEIAFQTNLLALNAAVEAARAGKYGKGFAVVAEEVRNLAARSAEAAKTTTELIENSVKEVAQGVDNAKKTGAILNEITAGVKNSNDIMDEIAEASSQQSQGISEINAGISQINEAVQRNSAVSQETAASSTQLSGQASQLQSIVRQFKISQT